MSLPNIRLLGLLLSMLRSTAFLGDYYLIVLKCSIIFCIILFAGDTLFVAGCGRFFEGTAEQMYSALIDKLGSLPDNTQVYCGHEYTQQNLKFAQHVERDNPDILNRIEWAKGKRANQEPTVSNAIKLQRNVWVLYSS